MSVILHIESATDGCSVAVSDEGQLVFDKADREGHNNAVSLGVLLDEALALVDSRGLKLDAVAVSEGPGSYTGLRIGVSMAKGVCYGRGLKLISVSTLKLLCVQPLLSLELPDDALLCPMIDARRMEVYSAIYDRALNEVREIRADIVDGDTYREYLDKHPVWFMGNGAAKCRETINHPNARFLDDINPEARWMFPLAEQSMNREEFRDVAYFEPYYLKDFIAVKPKKTGLMNYNTQREKMPMPEYGRAVQEMVEYAVTIPDRAERQHCANTIINIMGSMFPTLRDVPDFQGKLWDHLAFMSDYKLDIDYPCEITRLEKTQQKPEHIDYPAGDIRYRHYGHIVPSLIKVAVDMPEGPERSQLVRLLAVQMKKDLMTWNKELVSDERIAADIDYFSHGRIRLQDGDLDVQFAQAPPQQRAQQHGKKKNKRRY